MMTINKKCQWFGNYYKTIFNATCHLRMYNNHKTHSILTMTTGKNKNSAYGEAIEKTVVINCAAM